MRIISNFHDYYDGVQSIDENRELIYNRITENYPINIAKQPYDSHRAYLSNYRTCFKNCTISSIVIGFCGGVYFCLKIGSCYHYGVKTVDEYYKTTDKHTRRDYFNNKLYHRKGRTGQQNLHEYFYYYDNFVTKYNNLFDQYNCPVFVIHNKPNHLIINPSLKDYEFYKIFDAYSAYQELSMYLGNLATPEKTIPEIDDKTMIEAKGFDLKYSFRKPKRI